MTQILSKLRNKFSINKINHLTVLYVICFITGFAYLIWRTLYTLNYSQGITGIIWSILLLVAEIYTFVMFSLFSLASISKDKNNPHNRIKDLNYFPNVDIFICTYNESENILNDTIVGCLNIKYPNKKVYLLDDGNRENIRKLAENLGCDYISREKNTGFKAGNINNALIHTDGDLIAVFDADHIPVSTFLMELVDYFKDEKTALVQTPQHFFNPDPFQKNLKLHNYISNEQDLFFKVIQPGLSEWNATICSGTNFLMRREILQNLNGIPENTITEDMDVGLRMQSTGNSVIYYNKPLAAGLAPETFKDYVNQRLRWAKGTIQIFLGESNKFFQKLNLIQKSFYFSSLLYYFFGIPRLIFLFSPIVFLLFGILPVSAWFVSIIVFQLVCFSVKLLLMRIVAKAERKPFFTDVYETSVAFLLSVNVAETLISPFKHKFKVTNKGIKKANNDYSLLYPQLAILVLAFLGLAKGLIDYSSHISSQGSILLNIFWNLYNMAILYFSIKVAHEKQDPRKEPRINFNKQIKIEIEDKESQINLVNLSKRGALLFSQWDKLEDFQANLNTKSYLTLAESKKVEIELVNSYPKDNGRYFHVKFDPDSARNNEVLKIIYANSENWN